MGDEHEDRRVELGKRIKDRRKSQRLSQADLARKSGLGEATIRRIEAGNAPEDMRDATKTGLERALAFRDGYVDRVLAGTATDDDLTAISLRTAHDRIPPADAAGRRGFRPPRTDGPTVGDVLDGRAALDLQHVRDTVAVVRAAIPRVSVPQLLDPGTRAALAEMARTVDVARAAGLDVDTSPEAIRRVFPVGGPSVALEAATRLQVELAAFDDRTEAENAALEALARAVPDLLRRERQERPADE